MDTHIAGEVQPDRSDADRVLEQSHQQFALLFHQAPIGYLVLNDRGLVHQANETFCRMVGRTQEQLMGQSFSECLERDDRALFDARYQGFFKNPTEQNFEVLIQRSPAPPLYGHLEGALIQIVPTHHTPFLLLAVIDITGRKWAEEKRLQLERQLQQTQKLESLGVLAGGIAHDFNNLLAIILGNASLALDDLPQDAPTRENLCAIESTALRAAELCRQMLAYSGKGRFAIENIRLGGLIGEMVSLLKSSLSKKATLSLNLKEPLPALRGDPSQIRQIVMNLVINASEAIGDRSGTITISTGTMACSPEYLSDIYLDDRLTEGTYVWLQVADTGCGMDAETQRRIFEPFFTTKFTGRGLGLSAVLGIMRGHRGTLKVHSKPGKGTTIKVLFPTVLEEEIRALDPNEGVRADWRGSGIVLLVDDEEFIRATGNRMLERLGFQVLAAADGRAALEMYRARREEIALVLLDLTMPHMDGAETFRELRRIDPDVRVVMSSGYTESEIAPRFASERLTGFLQKPYTLYTLAQCLRNALHS